MKLSIYIHNRHGPAPLFKFPCAVRPTEQQERRLLSWLFEQLNRVGDESGSLIDLIDIPMPSMSVGDEVQFVYEGLNEYSEATYTCEHVGWKLRNRKNHR